MRRDRHTFDGPKGQRHCDHCGFPATNIAMHLLASEQTPAEPGPRPPLRHSAPLVSLTTVASTSVEAAFRAWPRVSSVRGQILAAIREYGPCTDDDLETLLERGHGSVSGGTNRLRADGWLEYARDSRGVPVRKAIRTGGYAQVMTLTAAARDQIRGAA
jgi:hypothetical protein